MTIHRGVRPLLLLTVLTTVFFSPVLFTGKTFFVRDLTYLFHPWKTLCAEMVQRGEMPLWNPYAYSGMPLLANWQSAVFYPFSHLFYFFHFSVALKTYHFLHILLAGLFAYLFARGQGFSRGASSACMVLFALNGYIITRLEFLSHVGTDIWLFGLLALARSPLALAAALAMAFCAGHQMFFMIAAILIGYFLVTTRENRVKTAAGLITAFILAAGIAACQLLPTIELAVRSARVTSGIESAVAMLYSVRPENLSALLSPVFNAAGTAVGGEKLQWTNTYYAGLTGIALAVIGLFSAHRRRLVLWSLIMGVTGVFLALGDSTPFYPLMFRLAPLLRVMRYPVQYMLLVVSAISVLAAIGVSRIRHGSILVILLALELLIAGWGFQSLAPDSYYDEKPASIAYLQRFNDGRFLLSPGMEKDRNIPASSVPLAWQKARACLYGLVCLPYHLRNAYGFGEPLTLSPLEDAVEAAYEMKTPQESLQYFSRLGVLHLLSRKEFPVETGYRPPVRVPVGMPLYIYPLERPESMAELINGESVGPRTNRGSRDGVRVRFLSEAKACFDITSARGGTLVWKEVYFPGWDIYIGGKRREQFAWSNLFRACAVPPGNVAVYELYRPRSFHYGIMITIASIIVLALVAAIRLKRGNYGA
jgi:hypothetical protein